MYQLKTEYTEYGFHTELYCENCREICDWFDSYEEYRTSISEEESKEIVSQISNDLGRGELRSWFDPQCIH